MQELFGEQACEQMTDTYNAITENAIQSKLSKTVMSMFTGILSNHQQSIDRSFGRTLQLMNFKVCEFVNKTTGLRCTERCVIDRKTGKLSKYCRQHKYMCEKNDRIKFLDLVEEEQPTLSRREIESRQRQSQSRSREVDQARNSDGGSFSTGVQHRTGPRIASRPDSGHTSPRERQSLPIIPATVPIIPPTVPGHQQGSPSDAVTEQLRGLGLDKEPMDTDDIANLPENQYPQPDQGIQGSSSPNVDIGQ